MSLMCSGRHVRRNCDFQSNLQRRCHYSSTVLLGFIARKEKRRNNAAMKEIGLKRVHARSPKPRRKV